MGWTSRKSTGPRGASATGNPAADAKECSRSLVVVGTWRDWAESVLIVVGVAAFAALLGIGWLAACPVLTARRWLAGEDRRRPAKEASVFHQHRIEQPEAVVVEQREQPDVIEVTPEEFGRRAAQASWQPETIRLLLTYRLPGRPVVYGGDHRMEQRTYRIVPVRPPAAK
jgi:hypothetical protein